MNLKLLLKGIGEDIIDAGGEPKVCVLFQDDQMHIANNMTHDNDGHKYIYEEGYQARVHSCARTVRSARSTRLSRGSLVRQYPARIAKSVRSTLPEQSKSA